MFTRASEDVFHSVPHSPTRLSSVNTEDLEHHFGPSPSVHQANRSEASPLNAASNAEEQKTELSSDVGEVREKKKKPSLAARFMNAFK